MLRQPRQIVVGHPDAIYCLRIFSKVSFSTPTRQCTHRAFEDRHRAAINLPGSGRMTGKPHLTRWPFGRVTEGLPTIREFRFNSVNTCAFSGTGTTILGARNPPPIG